MSSESRWAQRIASELRMDAPLNKMFKAIKVYIKIKLRLITLKYVNLYGSTDPASRRRNRHSCASFLRIGPPNERETARDARAWSQPRAAASQ
jgi:hypothetical protein